MARRLRFVPEGSLVEITARTVQGRFLLKPGPGWTETFIGVLARAQELFPVKIHAFVCLSNHAHWLLTPEDAQQLAGFMRHVLTNLSKEAGRRHGWRGPLFERRYQAITVTDEEHAHVERLTYLLRHGAKENLVARPDEWPGPHCAKALRTGEPVRGVWISRTAQWVAKNRGQVLSDEQASIPQELHLEPLPCWSHFSPAGYRSAVADILKQIEDETLERHQRGGTAPLGVAEILAQHAHAAPNKPKRAPAPLVHAASRRLRREFYRMYAAFVGAFYQAVERLKAGCLTPGFPDGAFPPPLLLAAPG
ncbi:MAG: transposase [Thermoanaerobaculia bacterium]